MNKKSWQIIFLSIAVLIFIFFSLILPKFEQITYLRNKVDMLSNSASLAERADLQIKYHLPIHEEIKAKAAELDKMIDNTTWEKMILNLLQDANLRLKSKNSVILKRGAKINELKLKLIVDGRYKPQMDFYKSIDRAETQTILRRYTLKNLEISEQDPHLLGEFELSHFTLKL